MKKTALARAILIGILAMLMTATAYAYQIGVMSIYYSDSGFTNEVGREWIPGVCCPEYEYSSDGNVGTTYRIVVTYDYCGWEQENAWNCQSYYNGSWHLVQCP